MSNVATEIKVGIFVILAIAVLVVTALTLNGNPFSSKKQHFYSFLANANGIAERTQVRTSGVEVGKVTSVRIDGNGVRIEYDVNPNVRVPKGSTIEIKSKGMLGDVFLEIKRNQDEKEFIHSGEEIKFNLTGNDMETLLATMNGIARDVKKMSANFAQVFGTEQGGRSLQTMVNNIEGITTDIREITANQKQNIQDTIKAFRDVAVRISALVEKNDTKLDGIISDLKVFTAQLRKFGNDHNRQGIEEIISNINESTATLKRLMAKVEKGEGTIGQLVSKNDTAEELKTTLKNIQEVVKPIAQLRVTMSDRAEVRLANAKSGDKFYNEFDLKFATRPDRYYLLGITTAPYAREVQTTVATTSGSSQTVETNTTEDVGKFRFNAQIFQRFSFVGVRLGLFASSAGFATDVFAFHDRLVGSVEFSHFNGEPVPSDQLYGKRGPFNIKAFASLYLTPNIFVSGGWDGVVYNTSPFPFIGAGLSITDEDIKSLIGIATIGSGK